MLTTSILEGVRLINLGQFRQAASLAARLHQSFPDDHRVLQLSGLCEVKLGNPQRGIQLLNQAAQKAVNDELFKGLAQAYVMLNQWSAAEKNYRQALNLNGADAECWLGLALACEHQNKSEPAVKALKKGLKQAPLHLGLNETMSNYKEYKKADRSRIKGWQKQLDASPLSDERRASNQMAIAKAWHDVGDYAAVMSCLVRAKQLLEPRKATGPSHLKRTLDAIPSSYARPEVVGKAAPTDSRLILGFSRSGKTLLASLMACHPGVVNMDETPLLVDWVKQQLKAHNDDLLAFQRFAGKAEHQLPLRDSLLGVFPEQAGGETALKTLTMPDQVMVLGVYSALFPTAPLIWVDRALEDMAMACFMKYYREKNAYSLDLYSLGYEIGCYHRLMDYWFSLLPNPRLKVNYNELLQDPKATVKRVCELWQIDYKSKHYEGFLAPINGGYTAPHATKAHISTLDKQHIGWSKPYQKWLGALHEGYKAAYVP